MEEVYGAVILAGGKSERMNFPKIYLKFAGKTFLQHIVETYSGAGIKNICGVINNDYTGGEWKNMFDRAKSFISQVEKTNSLFGRFHSLKLGIKNLLDCDYVFIQNADSPFIDREIIRNLQKNRCSFGYTQPYHLGRKGHPILISKKIIQLINSSDGAENDLRNILKEFPKTDVVVNDKRILANINTREDYEEFIFEGS